jgi:tRNA modification GTPase
VAAPSYGDGGPIAALATAPGESALALIRCSGPGALSLAARVFSRPRRLLEAPGNTVLHGWILAPPDTSVDKPAAGRKKIDEVLVSVYRGPRSFTGEEGLDISCHGGFAAARGVMAALRKAAFREALPGEFSFRAFMNGKLDLTRAESVMELVAAKTDRGRERAVNRLSGALEREIRDIKALLVQTLAGTELYLDYSEDELGELDGEAGGAAGDEAAGRLPDRDLAEQALARLRVLGDSYRRERLYHDGALVVIAGRPNAGKSSLFNQLLREDRAIVTEIPGTTRDWIESWIAIRGIPVRLADTAGLHPSSDPVEILGMERSRELLREADLVLYLADSTQGLTEEDRATLAALGSGEAGPPVLLIQNKIDLCPPPDSGGGSGVLGISAKTGEGLPALGDAIAGILETAAGGSTGGGPAGSGLPPEGSPTTAGRPGLSPGIASARQKELIDAAIAAAEEALALADRGAPLDIIAPLLREGVDALGEITGEVSTAEILETMFSRFCVGK